ncbi:MAG: M23 family metallopeptidase [Bacilli bacterium]|nr:M23 family metallopeptidase [Bacilli bacterium]
MKKIGMGLIITIFSLMIFILGFDYRANEMPNEYYQVYLDDKLIGTIRSKDELTDYISAEGEKIKNKVEDYQFLLDYDCNDNMSDSDEERYNKILADFNEEYNSELKLLAKGELMNSKNSAIITNCLSGRLNDNEKYLLNNYIIKHQIYLYADKINEPNGLQVRKVTTYNNQTTPVPEIYEEISENKPFTVKGYQISIKAIDSDTAKTTVQNVYVLNPDIFKKAVESMIKTYLGELDYNAYYDGTQVKIQTIGYYINNVYVEENITIKEMQIPVDEIIYIDDVTLAKYLLFGTTDKQQVYIVQDGDTINSIAMNNKISTSEFLISNRQFTSESSLLFSGQQVIIGVTDPQLKVVVEKEVREEVESKYNVTERINPDKVIGDDTVIQKGENGLLRVSRLTKSINGDVISVEPVGENEILKYPIDEVIERGGKAVPNIGSGSWTWPTNPGYMITSYYQWRISPINGRREFHTGLDIAGTGYRSPIYAADNGTVIVAAGGCGGSGSCNGGWGNYVVINHNNGYYTMYAHMDELNVQQNQVVAKGTPIGYMGHTGWATGDHVHYEVWYGGEWQRINPLSIY